MAFAFASSSRFLPRVLLLDAACCLACGLLQLALVAPMATWTGLPAPLLSASGAFLLAYGAVVAALALVGRALLAGAAIVATGNLVWAGGCVGLLVGDWVAPTPWGVAWILLQAATVLVLAQLQWLALRRRVPRQAACA